MEEVAPLALVLTTARSARDDGRPGLGLALLAAAGSLGGAGAALFAQGLGLRLAGGSLAAAFLALALIKLWEYRTHQNRVEDSMQLLQSLAAQLPEGWYVLNDLWLKPAWGEPVQVPAVVLGPGGIAVLHLCHDEGHLIPIGHVWMVGQGAEVRAVPSPAAQCAAAADALREALGQPGLPVKPVVVLCDLRSVYHPKETGAVVVGAPHAGEAIRRCLGETVIERRDVFGLAARLSQFHG